LADLKAVIQAGGKGTRLAPYSTVLPKALMPIGEGTVIDHMLQLFADANVSTVYITISKFGPLIRSYCGDGRRWGLAIVYVEETAPLGTIGPLDQIRTELDGTFLVANSDIYIDLDIAELLKVHRLEGNTLSVVVTHQEVKIAYGVFDSEGTRVTGFREKPTEQFTVSTGIYCMEPGVFSFIPHGVPFGFDDLVREMLERRAPITAYPHTGTWIDIGRIEDLRRAQEQAATSLAPMTRDD
jgi:NDP-mannose synthase